MKTIQFIFSPTGGTQRTADLLSEDWTDAVFRVDLTDPALDEKETIFLPEADLAVIAVPSYAGRVPGPAARRLSRIQAEGTACVLVCVYGNRAYEDTLAELQDIAAGCGFVPVAAVAAVAEHSIMHQYAAGRPDERDAGELKAFGACILEKLRGEKERGQADPLSLPGHRPYKEAKAASMVPDTDKNCNGCGLCAEKCPVRAIPKEYPDRTDRGRCISCMRCVAVCPRKARKADPEKVAALAAALREACSTRKDNELFL